MNHRKVLLLFCVFTCFFYFEADSATIYLANISTGNGSGDDPSDRESVSTFNSLAGANPGDTISLNGTITNELFIRNSGLAGNPITILWETGAKLSQPAGSLVSCNNQKYLIFDGGSNGIIENTDNGSSLDYQKAITGISANGCSQIEVGNLTFRNFFVTSGAADSLTNLPFSSNGAIYMNTYGSNISIHDNSFSNICWVLNLLTGSGTNINIYSNNFVNYDHGIAGLGNFCSYVNIFNNHFGSTACWDSGTNNYYHHDGIHFFFSGIGVFLSDVQIYNNLFDGNWGSNNTAHIFAEGDDMPNCISNVLVYNNVFIQFTNDILNDGFINNGGDDLNWSFFNNTFVGGGAYNANALTIGGTNTIFVNNLVNEVNTFVSIYITNNCVFSNNIYANYGPGGNSPWWHGAGINTFSAWQAAVGDANSFYTNAIVVNADGTLPQGSPAIGTGANLSSIFTTDFVKNNRPATGAWDVGAYEFGGDITTDLQLYYKFDEGSGSTAIDSSGNGYSGTELNSPTYVAGKVGPYALIFNGTSQEVTGPNSFYTGSAFTVACWFKSSSAGANPYGTILSVGFIGFTFYAGSDLAFVYNGSYYSGIISTINVDDGNWHHVVGVYDGAGTGYLYIDGVLNGSESMLPGLGYPALNVGGAGLYYGYYSGTIDEVRIYSRALNAADIETLYDY